MIGLFRLIPVFGTVAVPLLVWLLVAGRVSPRLATRSLARLAALALVVALVAQQVLPLVVLVASLVASVLGYAVWTLLLADAVQARDRWRLVGLAVVLALTLALQLVLVYFALPGGLVGAALLPLGTADELLVFALRNAVAIAAWVVALAFPATLHGQPRVGRTSQPPTAAPTAAP
jgi:hypothetical protein